jgi:zinc transporter, ZIP family
VVGEAALWGLFAGSSLVIGGAIGMRAHPSHRVVGLLMSFGAGVLISAVAYELVQEAFEVSDGSVWVAAGLAAGALVFYGGDRAIHARQPETGGRRGPKQRMRKSASAPAGDETAEALVLGTVLDGIPEGIVLGMSLIAGGGGGVAIIAAVFLSNLPEAIGATSRLLSHGRSGETVIRMWMTIMVLTAAASVAGVVFFDGASGEVIAFVQAFAGGALLTMLANEMFPAAREDAAKGGHDVEIVGLLTVFGFAVAFGLTQVG